MVVILLRCHLLFFVSRFACLFCSLSFLLVVYLMIKTQVSKAFFGVRNGFHGLTPMHPVCLLSAFSFVLLMH